jgi:hypothetical protein
VGSIGIEKRKEYATYQYENLKLFLNVAPSMIQYPKPTTSGRSVKLLLNDFKPKSVS